MSKLLAYLSCILPPFIQQTTPPHTPHSYPVSPAAPADKSPPANRLCSVCLIRVFGIRYLNKSLLQYTQNSFPPTPARCESTCIDAGGKHNIAEQGMFIFFPHSMGTFNLRLLLIINKPQTITRWIDKFHRPSGANAKGFA